MELSPRLRAIADQVPAGTRLADVGTDHAFLPVWLLEQGRISSAVASDLREGPLSTGMEVARQQCIPSDKISFRCCDGLQGMKAEEVDVVVIAGMGGETIAHILDAAPWSKTTGLLYLLQPMSSIPELRQYLFQTGFSIESEQIVKEQRKYYVILRAKPGQMAPMTLGELWVGRQQKGMTAQHRLDYIEDTIRRRVRALTGMQQSSDPEKSQLAQMEQTIQELKAMREEWITWQPHK